MALGQSKTFDRLGETTYTKNLDWSRLIRIWQEAFIDSSVVARNYDKRSGGKCIAARLSEPD